MGCGERDERQEEFLRMLRGKGTGRENGKQQKPKDETRAKPLIQTVQSRKEVPPKSGYIQRKTYSKLTQKKKKIRY